MCLTHDDIIAEREGWRKDDKDSFEQQTFAQEVADLRSGTAVMHISVRQPAPMVFTISDISQHRPRGVSNRAHRRYLARIARPKR